MYVLFEKNKRGKKEKKESNSNNRRHTHAHKDHSNEFDTPGWLATFVREDIQENETQKTMRKHTKRLV